jgi:hypothetical protein
VAFGPSGMGAVRSDIAVIAVEGCRFIAGI